MGAQEPIKCCKTCDYWVSWRAYMGDDDPDEPTDEGKCFADRDIATADDFVCALWVKLSEVMI